MENQNPPLDRRTQTLVELHELIDQLADRPTVPICEYGSDPLYYSIQSDDDETGLREVARIAAALGVPVTDSSGRPLKPDTYQFAAILDVGHARYKAVYILDADFKRYAEGQAWLAARRAAAAVKT